MKIPQYIYDVLLILIVLALFLPMIIKMWAWAL